MAGNLAPTNILDLANYVQQQGDLGRQQGTAQRFNRLAGEAYTAPAGQNRLALLGQAVQTDPSAGMALGNQLAARDSAQQATEVDHMKRLGGAARYMQQALQSKNPAQVEGAWQAVRPYLAQLTGKEPPAQWDPAMEPALYQAIAATGGTPEAKGVVVSAGGALVNPMDGQLLYQGKEKTPEAVRTLEALQQNPELAAFDMQRRAASRPVTNINTGAQENAFQKALGTKDADAYVTMRDQATQATNTLAQADQLAQILGAQKTGKIPEALAMAGQYFGTEAGANLQSLKGVIQPLVLAQVKQLGSGSGISDADRKFIESGMPGFGNDPRANERVLRIMRQTAQRKIDLYKQADTYVQKNGRLGGFQSPLITPEAPPSAAARPRAVNQQTGQAVEFDGSQWVPVDGQ